MKKSDFSLRTLWIEKSIKYDGSQLHSLFAYLNYNLLGNSIVAWQGPCDVADEYMADGEDLLAKQKICGSQMIHFIVELFDEKLITGVFVQRLFASLVQNYTFKKVGIFLTRNGDDLYINSNKLSISVATSSPRSILIHFAVNVSTVGTPVPTCSLEDLKISPVQFGRDLLEEFSCEFGSILEATYKVKPVR